MTERAIFEAAIEITDAVKRDAFLNEACSGDAALRERLDVLLASHDKVSQFLNTPAIHPVPASGDEANSQTTMMPKSGSPQAREDDDGDSERNSGPDLGFLLPSSKPGSIGLLGHYEILQILGRGAFGVVFKAFDEKLHRMVAIKVMNPALAATSPPRKRFLREARSSAAVRHENIVAIHAVEEQPVPYLVMEYIPGKTLQQWLDEHGPLDPVDVLKFGQQIAAGLAAAHAQGLIHRDIKPANILIDTSIEARIKITDFGLARAVDDASMTQSGVIAGTPMYMAPEQARGQTLDHRADLFSLGTVLYTMASGRPPFRASNTIAVLKRVCEDTPRPVSEVIPGSPLWLDEIIAKLHAKEPDDRFQSAKEVAELLARCQSELQLHGRITAFQGSPVAPRQERRTSPDARDATDSQPTATWKGTEQRESEAPAELRADSDVEAIKPGSAGASPSRPSTGSQTTSILSPPRASTKRPRVIAASLLACVVLAGVVIAINLRSGSRETSDEASSTSKLKTPPDRSLTTSVTKASGWHGWPDDAPPPAIAPFDAEQAKKHQEAWARYLGVPVEYTNSIGMKFRLIPPGEFLMGSTAAERDHILQLIEAEKKINRGSRFWTDSLYESAIRSEAPQHRVVLTQPFYFCAHETTQQDYRKVMGVNPASFQPGMAHGSAVQGLETATHPVESVTWEDAAEFCAKLSTLEQHQATYFRSGELVTTLDRAGYRLPSESQWEYACRAGTVTKYWSGDQPSDLLRVGWSANTGGRPHAVGELAANPFGLFDMHGNVWEWCQDWWDEQIYATYGNSPAIDPAGPRQRKNDSTFHVSRGGDWFWSGFDPCRSALRMNWGPQHFWFGFRVSLSVEAVRSAISKHKVATVTKSKGWHNWPADSPKPAIAPFTADQAKQHQEAWAKYLNVPVEYTNSLGMKFRLIPPGEFLMGSSQAEIDSALKDANPGYKDWPEKIRSEGPQHKVILTQPFYLGAHEVTQADYERVTGKNPSQYSKTGPQTNDNEKRDVERIAGLDTANHPVERVSWNDAAEFCSLLSKKETLKPYYFRANETVTTLSGTGYRLPTEAEWEYACRAGTTTKFWSGTTETDLSQAGWFLKNSGHRTHAVGELKPNPFGLFDIHGNVAEWVQDGWEPTYFAQFQNQPAVNPTGPQSTTSNRVGRGGYLDSYWDGASMCRSSARDYWGTTGRNLVSGFRVSLTVDAVRQTIDEGKLAADLDRDVAWWVLAGGGHGEIKADVEGVNSTFDTIEQLPNKPFAITDLYIHHKTVKAQELEKLTGLSHLIRLRYVGVTIGDNLTRHIEGLTNLTHLQLNQCGLTDVGVERLGKLSKLEYLDLNWQPGITDRGLAVVERMPQLSALSLINTSVTDKGLSSLRQLPLNALFLSDTKVTDTGMMTLAGLRSLEVIELNGTSVGDDGVAQLASLPKLRTLALQKTALTDRGLNHLATTRSLQTLHVGGTKVTVEGITTLRKALPNCKITADLAPQDSPNPTAADLAQWMKQVASRSADGQVVEVVKKLRELNPEFDGEFSHKVEKGAVTELGIQNVHIIDISPIRALPELKSLRLAGSTSPNQIGQLIDLSPLAGMKLMSLDCSFTRVKDLSPLKGMKLTKLHCGNTDVDDLSPLAGMPLTELDFGYTKVSDLSPLKGMPLTKLAFYSTPITDLSDLRGLPLTELVFFHNTRVTDLSPLEGMKLTVLDCFTTGVTDLSPLKGMPLTFLQCANTKVSDLSPLEGMPLTGLFCFSTQVEDLSPLKGMPLTSLMCERTRVNDDALKHLRELTKLETLNLTDTKVSAAGIASLRKALPNCKIATEFTSPTSPKPTTVTTAPATSPWDLLNAAQIPAAERVPEQPKELVAVLGEHRQRHAGGGNGVASISIRPDGKQFVTIGRDGLRFWDATTFQQTSHFPPKGSARLSAAYMSQGKQLVVGSEDFGNVGQIWNLDEKGISNDPPVSLPAGSGAGYTNLMVVSPDEKWLIRRTMPHSGKFHLGLIALAGSSPKIVADYPGCQFAAFSPDSRLMAILREDDKTIRILELGEGDPIERHVLKTEPEAKDDRPSKGFQQLVFLADGRLATADNNGRTWFWNLKGDQPQILFSTKRADQFLHAATQAPIVVTAESGVSSILRIDADQAVLQHHATWTEYGRPESNLTSFAIFPDGRTAITGHLHGAIRFWDITGEKAVEKHPIALQPSASPYLDLAMFPGVIVTRDEQNSLRLWKPTAEGIVEHSATRTDEPQKYLPVTTSRDGSLLVTIWGGPGCTLWQWNGETLSQRLSVGREGSWSGALSSDNQRLAIGYRGTVDLWDITARPPRLEKTLKATDPNAAAYQTAFTKDDTLLIASMNNQKTVWNLTQDQPLPEKLFANREPFLFAVSPTRDLLAVDGGGTQLLSVQQFPPQPILTLKSAPGQNGALAFSSDGKQLAVTDDLSVDRSIIDIHDTETGVRKHRITLPMPLRRLAFTEDNRHLVTVNANGTIYVLRLEAKPPSK